MILTPNLQDIALGSSQILWVLSGPRQAVVGSCRRSLLSHASHRNTMHSCTSGSGFRFQCGAGLVGPCVTVRLGWASVVEHLLYALEGLRFQGSDVDPDWCWLQGMGDVDEDLSWLWDDPDLEPDLFDDPLIGSAAVAEHQ